MAAEEAVVTLEEVDILAAAILVGMVPDITPARAIMPAKAILAATFIGCAFARLGIRGIAQARRRVRPRRCGTSARREAP